MTIKPRNLLSAAAAGALTLSLAGPVSAQADEASTQGTVNVAIRSVTVSPDEFTFDSECFDRDGNETNALVFPHGQCRFNSAENNPGTITITNGDAPAHMYVRATDFAGSDGGASWNLVGRDTLPAVDEVQLVVTNGGEGPVWLSNDDQCDHWDFDVDAVPDRCAAAPGQSMNRNAGVHIGPESTTNPSPSFSTTITWSALP